MGFGTLFARDASNAQFNTPILMDGGLGTTLEDVFRKDITHPLWSAKLVDNEEDVIVAAHLAFLQAGSQVILASTYQAACETFHRANYTTSDAERLMLKSVELAVRAKEKFEQIRSQTNGNCSPTKIALSLGPYGATLEPAAEFTGIYPPPYGAYHALPSSALDQTQEPQPPEPDDTSHINALAAFHFSRLLVYARNNDAWDSIDLLAFETIPLVTEAKAIRIAVARLEDWFLNAAPEGKQAIASPRMKPWYISFVFPGQNGEFIQAYPVANRLEDIQVIGKFDRSTTTTQRTYTAYEVAQGALALGHVIDQPKMSVPDAIGVNCVPYHVVPPIIEGFASAVEDMSPELLQQKGELPWLVLYPNGGLTYDPVQRTWVDNPLVSQEQIEGHAGENWAKGLRELIHKGGTGHSTMDVNVFEGLLIGGCCKTGPNEIKALKSYMTMPRL